MRIQHQNSSKRRLGGSGVGEVLFKLAKTVGIPALESLLTPIASKLSEKAGKAFTKRFIGDGTRLAGQGSRLAGQGAQGLNIYQKKNMY